MPRRGELAVICWATLAACGDSAPSPGPVVIAKAPAGHAPAQPGLPSTDEVPLCPAFDVLPPPRVCSSASPSSFGTMVIEKTFVCGELLQGTSNLLGLWRDPWTGLPYADIPCGGPAADAPTDVNKAFGVIPQLAFADITAFVEGKAQAGRAVDWAFVDRAPDETLPSLLWALRLTLRLDDHGTAGASRRPAGLRWSAMVDISRYARVRIRYRTSEATSAWQLALRSGDGRPAHTSVVLPGSTAWVDRTFSLADDFSGTDLHHLDHIVFATTTADGGTNPTLWVDQVSFVADPARLADCQVSCPSPLPAYSDLACSEPQVGAAELANALSFLATAPTASLLDEQSAKAEVTRILSSLESLPGARPGTRANGQPYAGGGWFQDLHAPASLMPSPRNRTASLAGHAQLFAALMVVESTWPDLVARGAALRGKMDWSVLYDDRQGCDGKLRSGFDRCVGAPREDSIDDGGGTDRYLGVFLAQATQTVPSCYWTTSLSRHGCGKRGGTAAPWYGAGDGCTDTAIPASDGGGPFVQLAGLLYLDSGQIPVGRLSLLSSARNMLRAQYQFARDNNLHLGGWANASDPEACGDQTCTRFAPEKVAAYPSAMAVDDGFPEAYHMLRAFHLLGADACLNTGSDILALGFKDSFDQAQSRGRDSYRYLHTGWAELGLLNACRYALVRQRFGQHPVAQAGYARLRGSAMPCP
jgi:hypothetical protein